MLPYCTSAGIAAMLYSPLASGRLSRLPGAGTKRLKEDAYAHFKYDATEARDRNIVERVAKVADDHGVSMAQVSIAWLLTKVTAPVTAPHPPSRP